MFFGLSLALVSGIINGSFALPMKLTTRWKWENTWLVFTVVAFLILPWMLVWATVADPYAVYLHADPAAWFSIVGFGFGFGLAQVLFGVGLDMLGLSLGFAITIGLSTGIGALVPLVVLQPETILTRSGAFLLVGLGLSIIGIGFCATAGRIKEQEAGIAPESSNYLQGVVIAVLAGFGASMVNLGLAFATDLINQARHFGTAPIHTANVVWAPLLLVALIPNVAYCAYLLIRKGTWVHFGAPQPSLWAWASLMGLLWMGSVALYGIATNVMGGLGPIVGWPIFMSLIILTSNAWGLVTGEWSGASQRVYSLLSVGILFLLAAVIMVALSSR